MVRPIDSSRLFMSRMPEHNHISSSAWILVQEGIPEAFLLDVSLRMQHLTELLSTALTPLRQDDFEDR